MSLLITADELATRLAAADVVIVDCRFNLLESEAGQQAWAQGHIPGAYYADLDRDLASPRTATSGRHPLPDPAEFATLLGSWGVTPATLVVPYDDAGGAVATRLWWLLGWIGHAHVQLLDGGLQAWVEAGQALTKAIAPLTAGSYPVHEGQRPVIEVAAVAARLAADELLLVDARDAARFAGEAEPIDTRAGHIPGSVNRPFQSNLNDGLFKRPAELGAEFAELLAGSDAKQLAFSCGSGVTACHNLFALELAGLRSAERSQPALYVGSWSEWIRSPERPCEP